MRRTVLSSRAKPPTSALVLAAVILGPQAGAVAQGENPRPSYKPLRYDENWSLFEPGDDYWDGIKHVDLNEDGSWWASFGGELRARAESWQNFGFTEVNDDTFLLGRALLHADLHFGERVRAFVGGKSALASDRDLPGGRRTLDVDELELQNAFVDVIFPFGEDGSVTARVGRQELLFGKQRLVSPLPWSNTMRTWDAARLIFEFDNWRVDAFYSRYAAVQKYDFNDWQIGPDFWGVYANGKLGEENPIDLDLYFLGLNKAASTFNGSTGEEDRYTLGARVGGNIGKSGFNYDAEADYQFGEVGSADISAYAFAAKLGYAFADSEYKPSLYLGFDYASGDDTAGDGDVETFNQLFPLGHAYFGFMDAVGRQNIVDLSTGFACKLNDKVTFKADGHFFWLASDSDALYNAGGGVARSGGASEEVGQEIDITLVYAVDGHLTLQGGYSHFFAGDFISDTGASDDMDWFYFQTAYKF